MKIVMKHIKTFAAVLLFAASASASAAMAIIANAGNPIAGISAEDAAMIYLGKTGQFPNGKRAVPADQADGTAMRVKFCKSVLKKDEGEVKAYWSKLMFSGKGQPPVELNDDAAVKAFVAGNPDGIGYIDGKAVDSSVKVLLIVP